MTLVTAAVRSFVSGTNVGLVEYVDDRHGELERKVAWLRVVALIETVTYLVLLVAWISGNAYGKSLAGSVHGMVWLAFVAMEVGVRKPMGWTWAWVGATVVTGPIGALMVYGRIRRSGVPASARV